MPLTTRMTLMSTFPKYEYSVSIDASGYCRLNRSKANLILLVFPALVTPLTAMMFI